jgi:hypothetical protein
MQINIIFSALALLPTQAVRFQSVRPQSATNGHLTRFVTIFGFEENPKDAKATKEGRFLKVAYKGVKLNFD